MKRKIIIIISVIFSANTAFAAFSKDDAGTAAVPFLKVGVGARAAAMGDAFCAGADDTTSIYWNPAGLSRIEKKELSFMRAAWFEDIAFNWISFAFPSSSGSFGIAVQNVSYGSQKEMDNTGIELGEFSPSETALNLSYANKLSNFYLGATAKYISSKIKEEVSSIAADIGAIYETGGKSSFGLSVQNIGDGITYEKEKEKLPLNIKAGVHYKATEKWKLLFDTNAPIDNEINFSAGTELDYSVNSEVTIYPRAGYSTKTKDTGALNGITAGIGLSYDAVSAEYSLDYAFVPYGVLGDTHRVSLAVKF